SSSSRHTRCYRDWSSDVCSSDLVHPPNPRPRKDLLQPLLPLLGPRPQIVKVLALTLRTNLRHTSFVTTIVTFQLLPRPRHVRMRSEERRVGKQWRPKRSWDTLR